jgi:hypothetical protein
MTGPNSAGPGDTIVSTRNVLSRTPRKRAMRVALRISSFNTRLHLTKTVLTLVLYGSYLQCGNRENSFFTTVFDN